jgi:hypothetical protein
MSPAGNLVWPSISNLDTFPRVPRDGCPIGAAPPASCGFARACISLSEYLHMQDFLN